MIRAKVFIKTEPKSTEQVADALVRQGIPADIVEGLSASIVAEVAARDFGNMDRLVENTIRSLHGVRAVEVNLIVQAPPFLPILKTVSSILLPLTCLVFSISVLRLIPLEPVVAAGAAWFAGVFAVGIRFEQACFQRMTERRIHQSAPRHVRADVL